MKALFIAMQNPFSCPGGDNISKSPSASPEIESAIDTETEPPQAKGAIKLLDLPTEIVQNVLEFGTGRDLKHFRLVSRACRELASTRLFGHKLRLCLKIPRGYHYCLLHGWFEYEGEAVLCHGDKHLWIRPKHCSFVDGRAIALELDSPLIRLFQHRLANGLRDLLPNARKLTLNLAPVVLEPRDSLRLLKMGNSMDFHDDIARFPALVFDLLQALNSTKLNALHVYICFDVTVCVDLHSFLRTACVRSFKMGIDLHLNISTQWCGVFTVGPFCFVAPIVGSTWATSSLRFAQQGSRCSRSASGADKALGTLENPNDVWDLVDDDVTDQELQYIISLGMENRNPCDK